MARGTPMHKFRRKNGRGIDDVCCIYFLCFSPPPCRAARLLGADGDTKTWFMLKRTQCGANKDVNFALSGTNTNRRLQKRHRSSHRIVEILEIHIGCPLIITSTAVISIEWFSQNVSLFLKWTFCITSRETYTEHVKIILYFGFNVNSIQIMIQIISFFWFFFASIFLQPLKYT